MAGLQLSDDEQSERLRQWWKENGTSVIVGAVLGIAVIGGVNYWRHYKAEQAEQASALYAQLTAGGDGSEAGDKLIDEYASTPYAGKGALVMARNAFEAGDRDAAKRHLQWALDNAADKADRKVARLRLARIELESGEPDKAEALLSDMQSGGYESEYRELLGDIAMARNDPAAARKDYQAALDNLPEGSRFADMLSMKLDAATGAATAGASE